MNRITRIIVSVAVSGITAGAGVLAAVPADASGGCVTRAEYRRVHNGMTPTRVARIYGTSGHLAVASGSGAYRFVIRDYRTCLPYHVTNVSFTGGRVSGKLFI